MTMEMVKCFELSWFTAWPSVMTSGVSHGETAVDIGKLVFVWASLEFQQESMSSLHGFTLACYIRPRQTSKNRIVMWNTGRRCEIHLGLMKSSFTVPYGLRVMLGPLTPLWSCMSSPRWTARSSVSATWLAAPSTKRDKSERRSCGHTKQHGAFPSYSHERQHAAAAGSAPRLLSLGTS